MIAIVETNTNAMITVLIMTSSSVKPAYPY